MEKPILIAATSLDEQAYGPVSRILEEKGYPVIIYRTDKVLSGEEEFSVEIKTNGELTLSYDNTPISPSDISAAWYRKIAAFSTEGTTADRAKQMHINNEVKSLHDTIWSVYPDEIWLNSPDKMRLAERKLGQLMLAKELGFSIPQTVISSSWNEINSKLLTDGRLMVVKMLRGVISDKDKLKALYTTVLDEDEVDAIKDATTPFPGIYQPFIDKFREWRVTVVGDKVFPTSIYTDTSAKDDWRKHQLTKAVMFKSEQLPEDIEEKCISFLGRMGLKFGAFDFIEKPNGEVIFLECNPNGQYGWLEESLEFPISESIALELIKISSKA